MKKEILLEKLLFTGLAQIDLIKKALQGQKSFMVHPSISVYEILQISNLSELFFIIVYGLENNFPLSRFIPSDLGLFDKYGCNDYDVFLSHLRNSIAHNHSVIFDDGSIIFKDFDKYGKENFILEIDCLKLDCLLFNIKKDFIKINDNLKLTNIKLKMKRKINLKQKLSFNTIITAGIMLSNYTRHIVGNKALFSLPVTRKDILIAAKILEMYYCVVWTREEDLKLFSISPKELNLFEKHKCNSGIDFLRHMRNSIIHCRFELFIDGSAIFRDFNNSVENFFLDLSPQQFNNIVLEFKNICSQKLLPKLNIDKKYISIILGTNCNFNKSNLCGCENLEQVVFHEGVTNLADWAFCNCKKLKLDLPPKLVMIGKWSFSGCKSIESLCFPSSIKIIDDYAFERCINIKTIELSSK